MPFTNWPQCNADVVGPRELIGLDMRCPKCSSFFTVRDDAATSMPPRLRKKASNGPRIAAIAAGASSLLAWDARASAAVAADASWRAASSASLAGAVSGYKNINESVVPRNSRCGPHRKSMPSGSGAVSPGTGRTPSPESPRSSFRGDERAWMSFFELPTLADSSTGPADHVLDELIIVDGIRSFSWRMPSCPTRPLAPVLTPPLPGGESNASNASLPATTRSSRSAPPKACPSPTSTCGGDASLDRSRPLRTSRPSCRSASHRLLSPRRSSNWPSCPAQFCGSPPTSIRAWDFKHFVRLTDWM